MDIFGSIMMEVDLDAPVISLIAVGTVSGYNVAPSIPPLTIGYTAVHAHSPIVQANADGGFPSRGELADMVDVSFCRDIDGTFGSI